MYSGSADNAMTVIFSTSRSKGEFEEVDFLDMTEQAQVLVLKAE